MDVDCVSMHPSHVTLNYFMVYAQNFAKYLHISSIHQQNRTIYITSRFLSTLHSIIGTIYMQITCLQHSLHKVKPYFQDFDSKWMNTSVILTTNLLYHRGKNTIKTKVTFVIFLQPTWGKRCLRFTQHNIMSTFQESIQKEATTTTTTTLNWKAFTESGDVQCC
jgi:hypothetical protein